MNLMVGLRMCSTKMSAAKSRSQIDRLLSFVVSALGITKPLKGLNPSKALGSDELHPSVLKQLASEFGPVFAHLFQQSIDTGEIPKGWSLANICPLFKIGDRSLACKNIMLA